MSKNYNIISGYYFLLLFIAIFLILSYFCCPYPYVILFICYHFCYLSCFPPSPFLKTWQTCGKCCLYIFSWAWLLCCLYNFSWARLLCCLYNFSWARLLCCLYNFFWVRLLCCLYNFSWARLLEIHFMDAWCGTWTDFLLLNGPISL
jgi:hypothetical protein